MAAPNAYELQREARIAQNRRRMEELGLLKLAKDLSTACAAPRRERNRAAESFRAPRDVDMPKRRSGRNAGAPAPVYNEHALDKIKEFSSSARIFEPHTASQDEIYTAEDLKKLGTYKEKWELFVDGYDAEGNRVYDKVNGETCHQCRQKTLGRHTACTSCKSLRGVFCGDCLFMRYGENLAEVMVPDNTWECPVCRDLCNCSFHRIKKGWGPTGTLYRRAIKEGYASVAHYLLERNQAPAPAADASEAAKQVVEPVTAEAADEEPVANVSAATPAPLSSSQAFNATPAANKNAGKANANTPSALDVLLNSAVKAFAKTRAGKAKQAAMAGVSKKAGDVGVAGKGVKKAVAGSKRVTRGSVTAIVA